MRKGAKYLGLVAIAFGFALSGCVTDPTTGQTKLSKTAMVGVGSALTCGIIGGLIDGGKGATIGAAGCGAIGAGVGAYMDYQEKLLRQELRGTNVQVQRQGDDIKLIVPENVTFATGSSQLNSNARRALEPVAQVLSKYNETRVEVSGFADSTGSDRVNIPLSQNRARAVGDYLYEHGVARGRITTRGYGSQYPIASNATASGRAQNRRVEINIIPTPRR